MKVIKNGVRVVEEKVNLSSADLYSEAVIEYMRSYMDSLSTAFDTNRQMIQYIDKSDFIAWSIPARLEIDLIKYNKDALESMKTDVYL